MAKKLFPFFVLPVLFLICASQDARADRNEVRDFERLRLLQQATGTATSSTSSFENRVNAIFDVTTNSSPAYSTQAMEDAREAQAEQKKQAEAAAEDNRIREKILNQNRPTDSNYAQKQQENQTGRLPIFNEDTRDKNAPVDASDETFQKLIQEDQERKKLDVVLRAEEHEKAKNLEETANKNTLPPSLANNPFYFAANKTNAKNQQSFEDSKPVIMSRLIQNGFTQFQVQRMLADASTPEELILLLMNEGKTYGEASELVHTE